MTFQKEPTLILHNARIITLDPDQPTAEAMAIAGEQILAVGSDKDILPFASSDTVIENLSGQVVIPGFNDSHMHLLNLGQGMDGVNLVEVRSVEEMILVGQDFARQNPNKEWIIGRGFNDENFSPKTLPTRSDLDQISQDRPVFFYRVCGHVAVVNSKALELAGINSNTPDPPGGSIDRTSSAEATGVLRENAIDLVTSLIPSPTVDDLKRFIRIASNQAASLGLTTVQSNDLHGTRTLKNRLEAYGQLVASGELPIRVQLQATMPTPEELHTYLEMRKKYPQFGSKVSLGPLKLYADGSLGARTAALSYPYADQPEASGMPIHTQEELDELVMIAAKANLPVAVHAIGDRAMDMVLDSYERAKNSVPCWTARPRIIHAQITRYDQLERMAKLGIVADIQPIFVPTDLHFVEQRIGKENSRYAYAWKTMINLQVPTAGGSDAPVEPCNPLWGMHAAVTRQDRSGYPAQGWNPQECLTPWEALALYTTGSAYAAHEEAIKGSISPGKLADLVVLPADPTRVEPTELLEMKVAATFVGGQKVFAKSC
ncbi:MAG: amidohydrolase [Firmicutes bacterium]|nr:amidohydrolase [Bacillota bacterium]